MAHIRAYQNHLEKLVKCLPMDDTLFTTKLSAQQLLPGDTESRIKALSTQADKASYFLTHVIQPALGIDETSDFDKLLSIMHTCGYNHVQKLAVTIKCEIDKSDEINTEMKLQIDKIQPQTDEIHSQTDEIKSLISGNMHAFYYHIPIIYVVDVYRLSDCLIGINNYIIIKAYLDSYIYVLSRENFCDHLHIM